MRATVELPAAANSRGVFADGKRVPAQRAGRMWVIDGDVTGTVTLEVR